ncbi:TPA: HNH endonuclease [Enterobacter kobei]|nr:HNH endonuclease [Enterobacter kobei]
MPAGSRVGNGYYQVKISGISYGAHRVVWSIANGEIPQGMTIDHIDRNPENNEISNLRLADKYLQARNRKPYKRVGMAGKSKGNIHLRKSGRYDATVGINGKIFYSSGRDKSVMQAWISSRTLCQAKLWTRCSSRWAKLRRLAPTLHNSRKKPAHQPQTNTSSKEPE